MRYATRSIAFGAVLALSTGTALADALPYADSDTMRVRARRYHVGGAVVGMNHLGGTGIGFIGYYGDWQESTPRLSWGGEALFFHSGERRVRLANAHNKHYAADSLTLGAVYEEAGSIGVGATGYLVLTPAPRRLEMRRPGVAFALSGGVMIETDRVGLRSSSVDAYYGTGNSDMDFSFGPYVRPQIIVSNGPLSLVTAVAFFPVFPTWSVGMLYGW